MLCENYFEKHVYSGFPSYPQLEAIIKEMIEDRRISYDSDTYFISHTTMETAHWEYTAEEYAALQKLISVNNIPVRHAPMLLWDGFEHVWYPENTSLELPRRGTDGSAGYDFHLPKTVTISDKYPTVIKLGVRWVSRTPNQFLLIRPRSKFSGVIDLQCSGVIDADYAYNPDTFGEISIIVRAYPGVGEITLEAGERVCQGIIMNYDTVAMDIPRAKARTGGFGSTDKAEQASKASQAESLMEDIVEAELLDELALEAAAKEGVCVG